MSKTYRPYQPEQELLLPPSLRDWLPENHLAYFVSDLVDQLDLSAIYAVYEKEERGQPPYDPRMRTKLLVYGYCVGVCSARKIQRVVVEDVAFRVLAAGNAPDFRTIADFRKIHRKALEGFFEQVLRMALEVGAAQKPQKKIEAYLATGRQKHGERVEAPRGPLPKGATRVERMKRKLPFDRLRAVSEVEPQTMAGAAIYAARQGIVEPVFGQIQQVRGFRRFSLRGLAKVQAEWALVCATHNLLKLYRLC